MGDDSKSGDPPLFPRWLLWLLFLLIPISIGPWWFRLSMIALVAVIALAIAKGSKARNPK